MLFSIYIGVPGFDFGNGERDGDDERGRDDDERGDDYSPASLDAQPAAVCRNRAKDAGVKMRVDATACWASPTTHP